LGYQSVSFTSVGSVHEQVPTSTFARLMGPHP